MIISVMIFVIGVFHFDCQPVELAGGLALIFAPYIAGQSYRGSLKNYTDKIKEK